MSPTRRFGWELPAPFRRPRLRRANYWDGWGGVRETSQRRAAFGGPCWRETAEGRLQQEWLQGVFARSPGIITGLAHRIEVAPAPDLRTHG